MAEVGADDEEGLGAAPEGVKHLADFLGRGVADGQRHQREVAQDALQERQLHLEGMLVRVGLVQLPDLRERPKPANRFDIHRHKPKRRREGFGGRRGQAVQGNEMRRPEQDDALDLVARRDELRIGGGGDGPGVKVAGVRRDEGFGRRPVAGGHLGEQVGR